MSERMSPDGQRLHVVFGAGQIGRALATHLLDAGLNVRTVSRTRPPFLPDGFDWRLADAADPAAAAEAAQDAAVIYQCLNAPYTQWPQRFPALQLGVLSAAERCGALLVTLENLYGYGPMGGQVMTEELPLAATTIKGRTRAAMTQVLLDASEAGRVPIAIGRAADLFGAGVTQSALGDQVFAKAVAGKRADFLGNPDLLHTYSYVPDVAAGLAVLGTDDRAIGQVWHLPGPETVTTRQVLDLIAIEVGHAVAIRSVPTWARSALSLVNPMLRGLAEMSYEFEEPFVMDTTKFDTTFAHLGTPLAAAVTATVRSYQSPSVPSPTGPRP